MSVTDVLPIAEPLLRLAWTTAENALREPDPARYLRRRIEAEVAHRAAQLAATKALAAKER